MRFDLGLPRPIVPIFWGMIFLEATFGAYFAIFPLWIERLGAPVAIIGLVLGASGFLRIGVLLPSAVIADRLGHRRAIVLSRAIAAVGLLSAALATHWTHLALMVVATTIGELAFPLVHALVAAHAGTQRMRAFAMVITVGPSASLIISPLIAGGLVALWGMRAGFVMAAVCTTLSLFFLARVEEPPAPPKRASQPASSYRAAWNDTGVRLVVIFLFAAIFSLSLGAAFVPVFLEDVRGLSPAKIATLGAAGAVGSAFFGLAVARVRRLQRAPFVAVALAVVVTAIGFVLFRSTAAIALVVLAFFCRGGIFSAWATMIGAMGELAPAVHRARAFALGEMGGGVAFALGPIIAGPLYTWSPALPLDVATVLCAVIVVGLVVAQRRADRFRRATLEETADPAAIPPLPEPSASS